MKFSLSQTHLWHKLPFPNCPSTQSLSRTMTTLPSVQLRDFGAILNSSLSLTHHIQSASSVNSSFKMYLEYDHFSSPPPHHNFFTWISDITPSPLLSRSLHSGVARVILLKSKSDCAILHIRFFHRLSDLLRIYPVTNSPPVAFPASHCALATLASWNTLDTLPLQDLYTFCSLLEMAVLTTSTWLALSLSAALYSNVIFSMRSSLPTISNVSANTSLPRFSFPGLQFFFSRNCLNIQYTLHICLWSISFTRI